MSDFSQILIIWLVLFIVFCIYLLFKKVFLNKKESSSSVLLNWITNLIMSIWR